MPPGDADRIRQYLCQAVQQARNAGQTSVTFRAGDVRQAMGNTPSNATICHVLENQKFRKLASVEIEKHIRRPPSGYGANLEIVFRVLPNAVSASPKQENPEAEPTEQNAARLIEANSKNTNVDTAEMSNSGTGINERLKNRLLRLTSTQFEHLLGKYFSTKGFSRVEVTGRTNDGGIDGTFEIPFLKLRVAFQAKRYKTGNNIGIDPVQRLNGSLGNIYDRGVFVTTSSFTHAASGWVEEAQAPITLVDGDELVRDMIELGLGVREVPVVEINVDEQFFGKFND